VTFTLQLQGLIYDCVFCARYRKDQNITKQTTLSKAHAGAIVFVVGDNVSGEALTESSGHYSISEGLKTGTYNVSAFAIGYLTSETSNV
jgi:hypothetical protein